jgi:hypothetical protein
MASGVLMPNPLTTLDDLLDDGDEDHLICGCRPALTMCGRYDPDVKLVLYKDLDPGCCKDCVKIWEGNGCGACGCSASNACGPCLRRYHEATFD